jgi:hypothetical protein
VVDLDAAFGEQLLDVAVGKPLAQVPAHRHHDHLGRERNPRTPSGEQTRGETEPRISPINPA